MADAGSDLLVLEMMKDLDRLVVTLEAALSTGLPVWVGLSCKKNIDGKTVLLGGESLSDAIVEVSKNNKLKTKSIIVIGEEEALNNQFIIRLFTKKDLDTKEECIFLEDKIKLEKWLKSNLLFKSPSSN